MKKIDVETALTLVRSLMEDYIFNTFSSSECTEFYTSKVSVSFNKTYNSSVTLANYGTIEIKTPTEREWLCIEELRLDIEESNESKIIQRIEDIIGEEFKVKIYDND